MADTKITSLLTPQVTTNPATDVLPIVNIADTSMASSGSTRKITVNTLLGAGGTATLASATITGDLTVRTNKLAVTSTGVGVGTASPTVPLYVTGNNATATAIMQDETNGAKLRLLANSINFDLSNGGGGGGISVSGNNPIIFQTNGSEQMRLNSTGLGVGGSPAAKISCAGYSSANQLPDINIARSSSGTAIQTGPNIVFTDGTSNNTVTLQNSQGRFGIWNYGAGAWNERLSVDSSGNVGIGVTPSAWNSSAKALQISSYAAFASWNNATGSVNNAYLDSSSAWRYLNTAAASIYYHISGAHTWQTAPSGTAGQTTTVTSGNNYTITAAGGTNYTTFGAANNNVGTTFTATSSGTGNGGGVTQNITFTTAMTLDASGNLLVGTTVSPSGTKIGSIAKLGKVNVEGTNTVTVSTSVVALARAYDTGGLFFISGYNSVGGNQGWWLVASRGGTVTTIASDNGTGLTVAFTAPGSVLSMNTTSGTLSVSCISMTNQSV